MIRMKEWFGWKQPESREARLDRLANELRSFTDEDRKMFFRRVYGNGLHVHKNPPKGVKKNRKEVANGTPDIS